MSAAASSASSPFSGSAAWPDLPVISTSRCRQPLCAVVTPYEKPAQIAKSGFDRPCLSSHAGPISPPVSSS